MNSVTFVSMNSYCQKTLIFSENVTMSCSYFVPYYITISCYDTGFVSAPDPRKHQSKEVVDPDAIFLISNSTLGDNGDQTVPYLVYQVGLRDVYILQNIRVM